jgi:hypothetical protein
MVSPNRQGHIVATLLEGGYDRYRNMTLHALSYISPHTRINQCENELDSDACSRERSEKRLALQPEI